ncbi:efflux RND transporter periplasmic adaptor subunit [Chryseolinea sp. T2]|uniref:efflux RND transporter periplasmic adaptor subunit n=1 Tax=Chryseolinea sp. T2 TaxID=3129255 RepID=UPI00307762AE
MKTLFQKFAFITLIVPAMMVIESCTDGKGASHSIPKASESVPVRTIELVSSSSQSIIKASGQFATDEEVVLGFKTSGIVSRVHVREGDAVKRGQLLATLDMTEINAVVAQARMNSEKAGRDFKRARNLYADSVATLEQFQNAETAVAVAERQLEAAEFNRSHSEIHAPADGYVLKKFVSAGQVVSTGDPVLLTNALHNRGWLLKVAVSDRQWSQLKIGDNAIIHVDAFPDKVLKGTLVRKAETADPASGAFVVELSVQSQEVKLATGMFGAAEFAAKGNSSTWSVPYESVLDAHDHDGFVFVTTDGLTAHKQSVSIESFNGNNLIVTSGFEKGQQLIVSGSAYLTDGSSIRIVK